MQQRFVGEILVRRGALDQERMEELLQTAEEKGVSLLDVLVAARELEEAPITKALADEMGMHFVEKIDHENVDGDLVDLVPIRFVREHRVLALGEVNGRIEVAVSNPLDPTPLDDLRALLGKPVEPVAATAETIEDAINRVYERKGQDSLAEAEKHEEEDELQDLIDMTDEAPVIRWVNNLFYNADRDRASDIHIEPGEKEVVVRTRIDGRLYPAKTAHKGFLNSIVSRVKIEAGLNIAEKRLPQDGRITKKIRGRLIDVRVSTIPTAKGERIVMRLLDKEKVLLDLTDLGFEGGRLHTIKHLVERPNGIVLVTGPTGSGKTTTLYACLSGINSPGRNILTAEDPVEYELPGVSQLQIHPKIGLTFASALRAFLRQDPDVIMVGEIRDKETAEIAIHASLTGHLVLSTLHTNDAAGAVTRLGEMGVQPHLVTSSVLGIIAQRLVRSLCLRCRQPYRPSAQDLRSLGVDHNRISTLRGDGVQAFRGVVTRGSPPAAPGDLAEQLDEASLKMMMLDEPLSGELTSVLNDRALDVHDSGRDELRQEFPAELADAIFYRAVGCDECAQTGYKGRTAIAEMLILDEPVRQAILNKSDAVTIGKVATSRGMRTIREDGARAVLAGLTSLEEVLAATQAGEMEG